MEEIDVDASSSPSTSSRSSTGPAPSSPSSAPSPPGSAPSPLIPSTSQPEPSVAVVLVTADWAGPARPAATVLRELSRRWGDQVRTGIIDASQDALLDLLAVDVVPTWLRLIRLDVHVIDAPSNASDDNPRPATRSGSATAEAGLSARDAEDSAEGAAAGAEPGRAGGSTTHSAPGSAAAWTDVPVGVATATTTTTTTDGPAGFEEHLLVRNLTVTSSTGERTVLAGTWRITTRRRGALPKHEVARDFGPDVADTDA